MNIRLKNKRARIVSVMPIAEVTGKERRVACAIKAEATVENDVLEELSPSLKSFLYVKDEDERDLISQDDPGHVTHLRFPDLVQPLRWYGSESGAQVTLNLGSEKHAIELELATVHGLRIEALEGGFVVLTFVIHAHPEEGQFEALCKLVDTEIVMTLRPDTTLV